MVNSLVVASVRFGVGDYHCGRRLGFVWAVVRSMIAVSIAASALELTRVGAAGKVLATMSCTPLGIGCHCGFVG